MAKQILILTTLLVGLIACSGRYQPPGNDLWLAIEQPRR